MIDFSNKNLILALLPQRGIPENSDASKNLQAFYKDMSDRRIHLPHL